MCCARLASSRTKQAIQGGENACRFSRPQSRPRQAPTRPPGAAAAENRLSLRRRRLRRRAVAHGGRAPARRTEPHRDRGERDRCGRPHRHAPGRGRGARWQHAAADADRAGRGLSARLQGSRIRPDQGAEAGRPCRRLRVRARGRAEGSGEIAERAGRVGSRPTQGGELRLAGRRFVAAFLRRPVRRAAGIDFVHIGYRGSAPAMADLAGGQMPVVVTTTSDIIAMHLAGRVRILATSDAKRSPLVPEAPTFSEAGYGIEGAAWYGLFAPAGTPRRDRRALQQDRRRRAQIARSEGAAPEDGALCHRFDARPNSPRSRKRTPSAGPRR